MNLDHVKIGTRLGAGFAIVLALLVAVLVLGLSSMSRIGSRTQDIIEDKNVKMEAANHMVDSVRDVTLHLTNIVVVPSTPEVDAELQKIAEARKRYGEAKKILADRVTDEKEKAMLANLDALIADGAAKNNKVIELRKEGEIQDATTYLTQTAGPSLQAVLKILNDILAHESAEARQAGDEVAAVLRSSKLLLVGLGVLAVALGAAVAWFITRSITVPLNAAVDLAETVAAGDLSTRIEVSATDETGRLLTALKAMNDSLLNVVGQVRQGTDTITVASTAAFSARMLVWKAMPSMTEMMSTILRDEALMEPIVSTTWATMAPPLLATSDALRARVLAWRALSAFCLTVDVSSSIDDAVSSLSLIHI